MHLLLNDLNLGFLKNIASNVDFAFFHSDDARHFISCFVARFSDNETCAKHWRLINNEIAVEYQSSLQDEFSSWNIYLALVTPSAMDKHLKYRIENDRFALRKLVLAGPTFASESDAVVREALENSILGQDLKLSDVGDGLYDQLENSNRFRDFLSTSSQLPLDGKERSSEVRRRRINELLERLGSLS
ncbi:hypothetical protein BZM26_36225 [Paraburkholderia strydomiana]|nr:hypothetical protein BZM26_36225 [Paraburkholderia strydomiana]